MVTLHFLNQLGTFWKRNCHKKSVEDTPNPSHIVKINLWITHSRRETMAKHSELCTKWPFWNPNWYPKDTNKDYGIETTTFQNNYSKLLFIFQIGYFEHQLEFWNGLSGIETATFENVIVFVTGRLFWIPIMILEWSFVTKLEGFRIAYSRKKLLKNSESQEEGSDWITTKW